MLLQLATTFNIEELSLFGIALALVALGTSFIVIPDNLSGL